MTENNLQHWYINEELTIVQAALLLSNLDPAEFEGKYSRYDRSLEREYPKFAAWLNEMRQAIISLRLKATAHSETHVTVRVDNLKDWLRKKGSVINFFFQNQPPEVTGYLNKSYPYYSKKLYAAIQAWEYVGAIPIPKKGKTIKARLIEYLTQHAIELGLADSKDKPNRLAIKEIAKVANWDQSGGAPKS